MEECWWERMRTSADWLRVERSEKLAQAMVRVEAMTFAQVARWCDMETAQAYRLLRRGEDMGWFRELEYKHGTQRESVYDAGLRKLQTYVEMTPTGYEQLVEPSQRERMQWKGRNGRDLILEFILADVLLALKRANEEGKREEQGVAWEGRTRWDMRSQREAGESSQAIWVHENSGRTFGVQVMPAKFPDGRRGNVLNGRLKKTLQMTKQETVVLLATRQTYQAAVRAGLTNEAKAMRSERNVRLRVWPLESFLANPGRYLETLVSNVEYQSVLRAWDACFLEQHADVPQPAIQVPLPYDGMRLMEVKGGYRFGSVYAGGDMRRLLQWRELKEEYLIPDGGGRHAGAYVFVPDATMYRAVDGVLKEAGSMVQAVYWDRRKETENAMAASAT